MVRADRTPVGIATRQKLILSGLYLSKYDSLGVRKLGFDSFIEAFNVIGYALGSRPASIKNYRDEFDPLFPNNPRKGWHKRPTRQYCRAVFEQYKDLDFESFTLLVRSFFSFDENAWGTALPVEEGGQGTTTFAQRLITGLAAEQYFERFCGDLAEFRGCLVENTTRHGCGYDFRLRREQDQKDFLAVEVKGLREQTGSLSMTPKEYDVASTLKDRFFLFVVKNFREVPSHEIFQNPLFCNLHFRKVERVVVQISWLTTV
jgi:hypothetical protein